MGRDRRLYRGEDDVSVQRDRMESRYGDSDKHSASTPMKGTADASEGAILHGPMRDRDRHDEGDSGIY